VAPSGRSPTRNWAHSITLAIATLGYASAPLAPLNAVIALSILFLGPEILRVWRGDASFTIRHPWVVAFPLVMAFGGSLGLVGVPLPGVEIGIAASAILLGAMVAAQARPPLRLAAAVVGFSVAFHGHAHGTELPARQSGALYSVGFVAATGCLHATGVAIGSVHRCSWGQAAWRVAGVASGLFGIVGAVFVLSAWVSAGVLSLRLSWARVVVRVAGSWIAATGLLLLGGSLSGRL
jgi:hydrogenase/urease accessory protein HupE